MAYITDKKLGSVIDIPICLPAVELLQGDWLVVSCVKLIAPMRLTYRHLTAQLLTITGNNPPAASRAIDYRDITADNKVSANLGLAFAGLYFSYGGGHPGQIPALDIVTLGSIQTVSRSAAPVIQTVPGVYSLIVANNMKPDASASEHPPIDRGTSIDFKLMVTGSIRLELHPT